MVCLPITRKVWDSLKTGLVGSEVDEAHGFHSVAFLLEGVMPKPGVVIESCMTRVRNVPYLPLQFARNSSHCPPDTLNGCDRTVMCDCEIPKKKPPVTIDSKSCVCPNAYGDNLETRMPWSFTDAAAG